MESFFFIILLLEFSGWENGRGNFSHVSATSGESSICAFRLQSFHTDEKHCGSLGDFRLREAGGVGGMNPLNMHCFVRMVARWRYYKRQNRSKSWSFESVDEFCQTAIIQEPFTTKLC